MKIFNYFQAIASLYLENKLGLSISVMFKHVICSSFPSVSSESSMITHLAVGAGLDFTEYWKNPELLVYRALMA